MPFTYVLRCSDESYYIGSTWDLVGRVDQHQSGKGAVYTSTRTPVQLVWAQEFERIDEAYALEKRLHGWSRAKREAVIRGDFTTLPGLSRRGHLREVPTAPGRVDPDPSGRASRLG